MREISGLHKSAAHNCWAYIVGADGEVLHCSDDGEPPGSAGKPMLNALLVRHLTNVCVVVTRYFGGIKLGIPGLIQAYSSVVADAIDAVGTQELIPKERYFLRLSYDKLDSLNYRLKSLALELLEPEYSDKIAATVVVPIAVEQDFLAILADLRVNFEKA